MQININNGRLLTLCFLRFVASNGAYDGILLSSDAVDRALSVPLSLSSVVLRLSLFMFLFSGLLPRGSTGQVADGFDDGTLGRVELTRDLTVKKL
jgi:hypothetical protein